jgi:hypothetical protein
MTGLEIGVTAMLILAIIGTIFTHFATKNDTNNQLTKHST